MRIKKIAIKAYAVATILLAVFMITSTFAVTASSDVTSGSSGSASGSSGGSGPSYGGGDTDEVEEGLGPDHYDEPYVHVQNIKPHAEANGPYFGYVGIPIQFDSTGSYDPEGGPLDYYWEFGDGGTSTEEHPLYAYSSPFSGYATLTVTDEGGLTDDDTAQVTVGPLPNQPPVADAGGPYLGLVGEEIEFDGSGSYDPDGYIVSWRWNLGDGTVKYGEIVSHSYSNFGPYTVQLKVTDNESSSDLDSAEVDVAKVELIIPDPAYVDTVSHFVALVDGIDNIETYKWDFGDGSTGTGQHAEHTYTEEYDELNCKLEIYGSNDEYILKPFIVTVIRGAPNEEDFPIIEWDYYPKQGNVNEEFHFYDDGSYDPNGGELCYMWVFNDGSDEIIGKDKSEVIHSFDNADSYLVYLYIYDEQGLRKFEGKEITVRSIYNIDGTNMGTTQYGDDTQSSSYGMSGSTSSSSSSTQNINGNLVINLVNQMFSGSSKTLTFYINLLNTMGSTTQNNGGVAPLSMGDEYDIDLTFLEDYEWDPETIYCGGYYHLSLTITDLLDNYQDDTIRVFVTASDMPTLEVGDLWHVQYIDEINQVTIEIPITWGDDTTPYTFTFKCEQTGNKYDEDDETNNYITISEVGINSVNAGSVPSGDIAMSGSSSSSSSSSSTTYTGSATQYGNCGL